MANYSISVSDLVKRPVINDKDLGYAFLSKMTDDEIDILENEIANNINQESPRLDGAEYSAAFMRKIVDRNILYKFAEKCQS